MLLFICSGHAHRKVEISLDRVGADCSSALLKGVSFLSEFSAAYTEPTEVHLMRKSMVVQHEGVTTFEISAPITFKKTIPNLSACVVSLSLACRSSLPTCADKLLDNWSCFAPRSVFFWQTQASSCSGHSSCVFYQNFRHIKFIPLCRLATCTGFNLR